MIFGRGRWFLREALSSTYRLSRRSLALPKLFDTRHMAYQAVLPLSDGPSRMTARGFAGAQVCQRHLAKHRRQSVAARLTVLTARCTMSSVPDRSTPGSWGPETTRLARVQGLTV